MPTTDEINSANFIATYDPSRGKKSQVTKGQWAAVQVPVRQMMGPVRKPKTWALRSLMATAARFAAWAQPLGYELSPKSLLRPTLIEAFLARLPFGEVDVEPYLWRLAHAWKTVPMGATTLTKVARRDSRAPYSADEMSTLLRAARAQATEHRQATVLAVVALGAGCGVVREAAAVATLGGLHMHGADLFFRAPKHCAKVLSDFRGVFEEVALLRPEGLMRGPAKSDVVVTQVERWLSNRRGVPAFSVDRLRATYITTLLGSGISLFEVLDSAGVHHAASLDRYLAFVERVPVHCNQSIGGAK
jgi:hypothetical protein